MKFKKLFEPIHVGKIYIKNRIAMAPMNLFPPYALCEADGTITQRAIDYYLERAKGGVGMIITSVFKVENEIEKCSRNGVMSWPLLVPKNLGELSELVSYLHSYGTKLFVQLSAGPGRNTERDVIAAGVKPVSASTLPCVFAPKVTTRPLTTEEVEKIVDAFGSAVELVATAGIDGVQIHGHEGYLIDQFMTSIYNTRNDKYGGDLEGRLKFPVEIIEKIKDTNGKDYPVIFRYGVKHCMKGLFQRTLQANGYVEAGRDIPESIEIAKRLEKAGVDALDLDAGCYDSWYWAHPPIYFEHGYIIDLVAKVKKDVNIPVITAGRLDIPELAEKVLEEGKADIVSLGRGLLADPYWPKKVQEGRLEDIRPCIGCHDGCIYRKPLSCAVNPSCGRERLTELVPATKPKKVLVAGGGVAGMEAAKVATVRGHSVILYEKGRELGGHLIEASVPNFKYDVKRLLGWYKTQMKKLNIKVKLDTEMTPEVVKEEKPDVVIVATGSSPIVPETPGIEKIPVVTACCECLLGKKKAGNMVVVMGGGLEGCETALWLAKQGKNVTIVEILPKVMATGIFNTNREMLMDLLTENNVQILTNTTIEEATEEGVILIDKDFKRRLIKCDTLVIGVGLKPEKKLYESLLDERVELYLIGDCVEPRKILDAIWDGFTIGRTI